MRRLNFALSLLFEIALSKAALILRAMPPNIIANFAATISVARLQKFFTRIIAAFLLLGGFLGFARYSVSADFLRAGVFALRF